LQVAKFAYMSIFCYCTLQNSRVATETTMPGPRPTPTYLKLIRGNPGCRKIKPEPQPTIPRKAPEPPDFLSDEAKAEWARVVPQLRVLGLLTALDTPLLAGYCQAYGRWIAAERILARLAAENPDTQGLTITGTMGSPMVNPMLKIARFCAADVLRFAAEFGFSPAARTRISAGISPEVKSKFGDLLA
jgi:P27 family predicted phage terminase small subunit